MNLSRLRNYKMWVLRDCERAIWWLALSTSHHWDLSRKSLSQAFLIEVSLWEGMLGIINWYVKTQFNVGNAIPGLWDLKFLGVENMRKTSEALMQTFLSILDCDVLGWVYWFDTPKMMHRHAEQWTKINAVDLVGFLSLYFLRNKTCTNVKF